MIHSLVVLRNINDDQNVNGFLIVTHLNHRKYTCQSFNYQVLDHSPPKTHHVLPDFYMKIYELSRRGGDIWLVRS